MSTPEFWRGRRVQMLYVSSNALKLWHWVHLRTNTYCFVDR